MYKTVRHGENSLQYKILAQQEEGVTNVKCRKTKRTVTAKLITVIILLIVGIIASAVLVPLILTNDFIALTGTFQKFSVSTLRRSHSGNHVVVIAKKPYGWNPPHSSAPPKLSNVSQIHSVEVKKSTLTSDLPPTTTESTTTVQTTKITTTGSLLHRITFDQTGGNPKHTVSPTTESTAVKQNSGERERGSLRPLSTVPAIQQQKSFQKETLESGGVSSTSEPVWFEPVKKWGFGSSNDFLNGMNGFVISPVSILGCLTFVFVLLIMFIVLRKTLIKRKTLTEKETAESKEDKTRLLSSSVSSDHDEE